MRCTLTWSQKWSTVTHKRIFRCHHTYEDLTESTVDDVAYIRWLPHDDPIRAMIHPYYISPPTKKELKHIGFPSNIRKQYR